MSDAVERALRMHPLLISAAERTAAGLGLRMQAGLRPNPRLTLQAENLRPYGGDRFQPSRELDAYAFLIQPFELGGKRQRRIDLAEANVRRAELETELVARQIGLRVRQVYWQAAGAQKVHDLLLETLANFGGIVRYHVVRVREGAMAESDLLKVQIEQARLAISANAAALEAERARIQLFREMGQTEFPTVRLVETLEPAAAPLPADPARALQDRTEMKLARQRQEIAEANLRLQRAVARPDLDVSLGYKRTDGFNSVLGGVHIALPFANRNQGNVAAAEAEIRLAQSELAGTAALVQAELRAAEVEVQARRRQIAETLEVLVARAAESSRIAQAAYREGGLDLLRLLDAERVRIELETLRYRLIAEYRQSLAAYEAAQGMAP